MRPLLIILLGGLAVTAGACATSSTPDLPEPVLATAPAPAPIDDHDWFLDSEADTASLAYGKDETDDVWLDLECREGSGRLQLGKGALVDAPPLIRVQAGSEMQVYPARAEDDSEMFDGVYLTAEASTSDPVFRQFRDTGWMNVESGGEMVPMVPHPGSGDRIRRFFAFCG